MSLEAIHWVFDDSIDTLYNAKRQTAEPTTAVANLIAQQLLNGHKVVAGGLGSAHTLAIMAGIKFSVRLEMPRPGLPALVLGTDNGSALSLAFEQNLASIYCRQIEMLGGAGDVLLWFTHSSTEDTTPLVLEAASDQGMSTIWLCANASDAASLQPAPDYILSMSSDSICRTEEAQLVTLNAICTLVESRIFSHQG